MLPLKEQTNIIKHDEHIFIAGQTGSGKTVAARWYLRGMPGLKFILDTKGSFKFPEYPAKRQITFTRIKDLPDLVRSGKEVDCYIYRPDYEELDDYYYNLFFKFCYFLRNCTVFVDEVMSICPNPSTIPEYYKAILTRGRELGINVFSCSQRPSTIPVLIYSESTHWFIFNLAGGMDRKRLYSFTGEPEFLDSIPKYHYRYYNTTDPDSFTGDNYILNIPKKFL